MTKKVTKMKLKKGDKVKVIAGSDRGKQGKILSVDRENNRVIVEGVNMLTKHVKPGKSRANQQGGIIRQEGSIHASNVMYIHKGKPVRLGLKVENINNKKVKTRVARVNSKQESLN